MGLPLSDWLTVRRDAVEMDGGIVGVDDGSLLLE